MTLRTASEGISHARALEEGLVGAYETIGNRWPEVKDAVSPFRVFAAKCITDVERTYYGVITDAIEGGFCFELEPDRYHAVCAEELQNSLAVALSEAAKAEEALCRFYEDAGEQSRELLADIPRVFERIAKRRRGRLSELENLIPKKEA